MPSNIEQFDEYAARIFALLYEAFPVPRDIDALELSGRPDVDENGMPQEEAEIAISTLHWLREAGYVWYENETGYGALNVVLSAKGLELLKVVPASLEGKTSIGERLRTVATAGSAEVGKKLIAIALTEGFRLFGP